MKLTVKLALPVPAMPDREPFDGIEEDSKDRDGRKDEVELGSGVELLDLGEPSGE
jgi:hypothetical protein